MLTFRRVVYIMAIIALLVVVILGAQSSAMIP